MEIKIFGNSRKIKYTLEDILIRRYMLGTEKIIYN